MLLKPLTPILIHCCVLIVALLLSSEGLVGWLGGWVDGWVGGWEGGCTGG